MTNLINISILIPLIPMGMAIFVFILLVSFNRTINRLTKPTSALVAISLIISALISTLFYFKKIEAELFLSSYFDIFEKTNLVIHLNLMTEKLIIIFSLISALVVGILTYKLPRKKGYVSLMVSIGLISSLFIFSIMFLDISGLS